MSLIEKIDTEIAKIYTNAYRLNSDEFKAGKKSGLSHAKQIIASEQKKPLVKMIDYDGEPVPEELCTVDRDGGADDFCGCGHCFDSEDGADCKNCVIDKLFKEYARFTNQPYKELIQPPTSTA